MEEQKRRRPPIKGRGASANPPNRFERIAVEWDSDWPAHEGAEEGAPPKVETQFFVDRSRTVLAKNESPDVRFDFSLNPYRGCEHGCVYCYARPTHEFLGFSAGLDFESRIMVKREAAALLEKELRGRKWMPQPVALSGNTDCYQPIERKLEVTRACLEVFRKLGNPVEIVTKGALVLRDLSLLREMAQEGLVAVAVSLTTLEQALSLLMEPRAAVPARRLEVIEKLSAAGVPTGVSVAPVIPGLTDHELAAILREAAARGASSARYIMLRLPMGVENLFLEWLEEHFPDRAGKVVSAIRDVRGGELSDGRFRTRMRGEGARADAIARVFEIQCRKLGLARRPPALDVERFQKTVPAQASLF
jgi:DNA repair photolyase